MQRATSAKGDLLKIHAHGQASDEQKAKATQLEKAIEEAAKTTSALKEVAKLIRGTSAVELAQVIQAGRTSELFQNLELCKKRLLLDFPVVVDMIQTIAKKLVDVASEGEHKASSLSTWQDFTQHTH